MINVLGILIILIIIAICLYDNILLNKQRARLRKVKKILDKYRNY